MRRGFIERTMPPAPVGLKDKLNAIRRNVRSEAFRHTPTDSPTVYHYTSPVGLIGILSQGRIRATSIRHFADKYELLYAERVFEQVLDEIKEEYPKTLAQRQAG
jgi:hypothetical protein